LWLYITSCSVAASRGLPIFNEIIFGPSARHEVPQIDLPTRLVRDHHRQPLALAGPWTDGQNELE
jgi:hypothetical protein